MIVKNNDERLIVIDEIKLVPGCNQVDSKLWERVKKEYNVDKIIDSGSLEEITEITKKGEKEIEKEFKDFDHNKKEKILSETFNLKTLEEWGRNEPDTAIRVQIDRRKEDILSGKVKEKYGKPNNHI